jgi:hypothetical protein
MSAAPTPLQIECSLGLPSANAVVTKAIAPMPTALPTTFKMPLLLTNDSFSLSNHFTFGRYLLGPLEEIDPRGAPCA